ncbi:MAG: two pore domain potassium channel family protein [Crocinitomicaceae bacterium]|nr:two pore domain potassium channel family protein [Crocinitomicaceae bacterium]
MKIAPIIIISFFSIISIILVIASFFMDKNSEVFQLAVYYDWAFCILFIFDFFIRLIKADNLKKYLLKDGGLLDLAGSVPVIMEVRLLRFFRLFRLFRALKSYRLTRLFFLSSPHNAIYAAIFIVITFVIISTSFAVLYLEQATGNIKTAEDTIWWAFITVTTVGYGDYYPITSQGKFFASILIFNGFIAFGTLISFINTSLTEFRNQLPR